MNFLSFYIFVGFLTFSRVNSNTSNRVMERYEKICDLGEGSQVQESFVKSVLHSQKNELSKGFLS
jgi:hypothetical protein